MRPLQVPFLREHLHRHRQFELPWAKKEGSVISCHGAAGPKPELLDGEVLLLVVVVGGEVGHVVVLDGSEVVVQVRLVCILPAAATLAVQAFPNSGSKSGCCPIDADTFMATPVVTNSSNRCRQPALPTSKDRRRLRRPRRYRRGRGEASWQ